MNKKPNILWLMTDEQRWDSCGFNGSPWAQTPMLDKYARDAVVFDNAYTPSPVCMPCRLSLLSGKRPSETGIWENAGNPGVQVDSLMEPFHQAGYRSASFGKQHYGGRDKVFHIEESLVIPESVSCYDYNSPYRREDYGGIKFGDKWLLGGTFPQAMEETTEWQAVKMAKEWLGEGGGVPFFLRLSFSAPHTPVVPPEPFDRLIPSKDIQLPSEGDKSVEEAPSWLKKRLSEDGIKGHLGPEEVNRMRQLYYGEVAFTDHCFGELLDWMEEKGLLDNTIIVFLSDHGTHLGDQGIVQKRTFFDASVRVPFFIRLPRGLAGIPGRHISEAVETLSLLPSLLELCGLEAPPRKHAGSLAGTLRSGSPVPAQPVISQIAEGMDRLVMVRRGTLKLILNVDDSGEIPLLLDLAKDPLEQHNLYRDEEYRKDLAELSRLIQDSLKSSEPIQALVKLLLVIEYSEQGNPCCPSCREEGRVQKVIDQKWARDYFAPHLCSHCGQKFAVISGEDP